MANRKISLKKNDLKQKKPERLFFQVCRGTESNCRHTDFQSGALPTELPRRFIIA